MPTTVHGGRIARLALALCLLALAAHPAAARKHAAAQAGARPFIETSYLMAPRQVGDFVLEGASYDEANKYTGAGFRYALKDHQETRFDVFVYPAGRASQSEAVERGMVDFKASFAAAEKAGHYRDVRFLDERDFPLDAPAPASSASPGDEPDDPAEARKLAVLRTLLDATRPTGRVLRMQMELLPQTMPMYSNGYLFHKQLYFFKVRASAARERIDEAAFNALTDMAARALVPAIEVANVGGCAKAEIVLDPKADPDAMAEVLVRRSAEIQGENCFDDAGKAEVERKSEQAQRIEIHFAAQEWKAQ